MLGLYDLNRVGAFIIPAIGIDIDSSQTRDQTQSTPYQVTKWEREAGK